MNDSYYGSQEQRDDLESIVVHYAHKLHDKEVSYRGSWQKRGGIGAFMMLARKADRLIPIIEAIKENWESIEAHAKEHNYDIFKVWEACQLQCDSELNDIHDLWGYLTLVITEMEIVRHRRASSTVEISVPLTPEGDCVPHTPQHWSKSEEEELSPSLASHPFNYPSAGNQCPQCQATSPKSTGDECTCRRCGHKFPKKVQTSAYDQKFPQAMIMRGKNAPETDHIEKG